MKQEILPPLLPDDDAGDCTVDPDDLPEELRFDPVPYVKQRWNSITDARQRRFIAHLAASGSVKAASDSIGASAHALYALRRRPKAESFAGAWDRAVEMGARRVADTLMDYAINGFPEYLIKDGKVVAQRVRALVRPMQHIAASRFPEQFGAGLNLAGIPESAMPHSIRRLKEAWRQEWEAERRDEEAEEGNGEPGEAARVLIWRVEMIRLAYLERLAPDPVKRAAWELLVGPADWPAIRAAAAGKAPWDEPQRSMHDPAMIVPLAAPDTAAEDAAAAEDPARAAELAETRAARRATFEAALDGPRPVFQRPHGFLSGTSVCGGPSAMDRLAARRHAETVIGEMEREWNAAYSEGTWAAWRAGPAAGGGE